MPSNFSLKRAEKLHPRLKGELRLPSTVWPKSANTLSMLEMQRAYSKTWWCSNKKRVLAALKNYKLRIRLQLIMRRGLERAKEKNRKTEAHHRRHKKKRKMKMHLKSTLWVTESQEHLPRKKCLILMRGLLKSWQSWNITSTCGRLVLSMQSLWVRRLHFSRSCFHQSAQDLVLLKEHLSRDKRLAKITKSKRSQQLRKRPQFLWKRMEKRLSRHHSYRCSSHQLLPTRPLTHPSDLMYYGLLLKPLT